MGCGYLNCQQTDDVDLSFLQGSQSKVAISENQIIMNDSNPFQTNLNMVNQSCFDRIENQNSEYFTTGTFNFNTLQLTELAGTQVNYDETGQTLDDQSECITWSGLYKQINKSEQQ
ncbi:hypothetical protein SS50377_24819 [Spironucleus salmonicida]|uniref:Uncharacterized protein n=1 Tax=Spironucleus salmonicida TaxID=348837 RepID=V6LM04_9EUKA|nr:hypothetical protein SS50377_24819 [Spironucleus salmonicida]|eukprot:EST44741.1 Hypothetical protein SS50377_15361 [Spironucleus salmonicida]